MKIKDVGEFGLIDKIRKKTKLYSKDVIVGIGDDTAVLKFDAKNYLIFTTDALAQNVHFSLEYFTQKQIGMKAIEQIVSDIAAMGGLPISAVVSLSLPKNTDVKIFDGIINGINKKCKRYKIDFVGGNLSSSKEIIINIAMLGFVEKKYLTLRSKAKIGDLIFCSGNVGSSSIGLSLLKRNLNGTSIKKHLEPRARLDLARKIVKIGISSMIDISDGIASEIRHICRESNVGAIIYADKIPISNATVIDSKKINKNPLDFALYGGEDFELVFTANKNKLRQLKKHDVKVIGEVVDEKYGIKLIKNGRKLNFKSGFDHFS